MDFAGLKTIHGWRITCQDYNPVLRSAQGRHSMLNHAGDAAGTQVIMDDGYTHTHTQSCQGRLNFRR